MAEWRGFLKRLAYVGLKPQSPAKLPLGERLRRRFERFADRLAGTPPPADDPLGTGHRTFRQNLRVAAMITLPVLLIGGLLFWRIQVRHNTPAGAVIVPSSLSTDVYHEVLKPSELEVAEIRLQKDSQPAVVRGTVRNHSAQKSESAEISFNVTDKDGMLLGAVTTTVRDIPPHGSQSFQVEIPQKDAAIVIVRDARRL